MAEPENLTNSAIDEVLAREANKALIRGGLYMALTAGVGGALIYGTDHFGLTRGLEAPGIITLVLAAYGLVLSVLAKAGVVRGAVIFLVFIPIVSMPTALFVLSHYTLPAGAATYLTGPFSLLYVALIMLTGFMFDWRLSVFSGFVAAAGYLASYFLARPHLAGLSAPDPVQLQDLTDPSLFFFRAFILVIAGGFVGLLSVVARSHIRKVLEEEQDRERVTRLFGEYVSPEVAKKLVSERSKIAGECKQVAVLFSDLRGFTTLSERTAPAELVQRLNEYFDRMVEAIGEHGGVVDKFIGDAAMAVFGGVLPVDNPCDAAVGAALAMRARLAELNSEREKAGRPRLENGVGVHFGEVLQGSIGSRGRKDFTVIGDAVNIASRIEGLTKETEQRIVLTREVYDRLSPPLRSVCVPLGKKKVKGREGGLELYGLPDPE